MGTKRNQKRRDREACLRELRQHHTKAEFIEISINREVEYMRRCAASHDSRCVTLDALAFFSTESGDAWMLDPDDGLALCLARDGVAQPVRILETDSSTVVEWDRTYSI